MTSIAVLRHWTRQSFSRIRRNSCYHFKLNCFGVELVTDTPKGRWNHGILIDPTIATASVFVAFNSGIRKISNGSHSDARSDEGQFSKLMVMDTEIRQKTPSSRELSP